jgi:para-nitrobenzyl esterase
METRLRAPAPFLLLLAPWLAAGILSCGGGDGLPAADPSSRRSLPAGEIVGFVGRYGSHAWRGIPYAAPPVGELRWRAPRPAEPWTGLREALTPGEPCPQYASVYSGAPRGATGLVGSEDCLTLDVWAPRLTAEDLSRTGARMPVMVWIHGGGHSIGSSSFYDGGNLAATHGVVVVAIQYRLGPLGWLRHAALAEGASPAERSGNFGTLDTIRALEWVRDHAAAFGGDPGNVTIFGESAGGTNVLALLLAPGAGGLFHRAILQSPGMDTASLAEAEHFADDPQPGHPRSSSEALARLLVHEGRAHDRDSARAWLAARSPAEQAAWLRQRSPDELLAAYRGNDTGGMLWLPTVFRDGEVLPEDEPAALLARGAYHRVPTILGTNRDEDKVFMVFDPALVRWRLGLFPEPLDPERYDAQAEALAQAWKARAVDEPARLMRAVQGPSVYAYRWDWDEEPGLPLLMDGGRILGAAHGLEIAFVFGHFDLGPESDYLFSRWNRAGRETLSAAMMSYWTEFAHGGSPGRGRGGDLPEWGPWQESAPDATRYAVLDTPEGGGIRMAAETWSLEKIVARVLDDPRLADRRARCGVLRELARDYLAPADYAAAGGGTCADLALDAWPWHDVAAGGE